MSKKVKKLKLPKSVTSIDVGIYFTKVIIAWGLEDLKKVIDFYDVEDIVVDPNCGGCCWQVKSTTYGTVSLVYMNNKDYATLAHELLHAVFDICDDRGVEYAQRSGNEAFAYLHTLLMDGAEKDFQKQLKKSVDKKKKV